MNIKFTPKNMISNLLLGRLFEVDSEKPLSGINVKKFFYVELFLEVHITQYKNV